ncbi:MAG: fibronectin type III domain-containing protein [Kiritimatiellia bacterium]
MWQSFRAALGAASVVLMALNVSGEVFVREGMATGTGGYASGAKLAAQTTKGEYLKGTWGGSTGVWLVNATSLNYPESLPAMAPAGTGAFRLQHSSGTDATGRSTAAQLVKALPDSGVLYVSCLGQVGSKAIAALQADQAYAIGLADSGTYLTTAAVSKLLDTGGFYLGFGRCGSDAALPIVQADGVRCALSEQMEPGTPYLFIARIDIGAGANGLDVIRAMAVPTAGFDGTLDWCEPFEADLAPETLQWLKVGGAFATNNDTAIFDEFILADSLEEATSLSESLSFVYVSPENVSETSVTLFARIANYSSVYDGCTLSVVYGKSADALDTRVEVGSVSASGTYPVTLSGLDPGFVYSYRFDLVRGDEVPAQSAVYSFETAGKPTVSAWTLAQEFNSVRLAFTLNSPQDGLTVRLFGGLEGSELEELKVFENVAASSPQEHLVEGLLWGKTYTFELRASYESAGGTVEMNPVQKSLTIAGAATWIGGAGAPWSEAANWDIATLPDYTLSIDARFTSSARVLEPNPLELSAGTVSVETDATLDLGGSTLRAETLQAGSSASAYLAVSNTVLTLDSNDPGSVEPINQGLYLGATKGARIYLGKGASGALGSIWMAAGADNCGRSITIADGANVSANTRVWLNNDGADFLVDNATLTAGGIFRVGVTKSGAGFRFTLDHDALLDASATDVYVGTGSYATFSVLGGATAKARNFLVGAVNDGGGYNSLVVSNANLEVSGNLSLSPDSRYHSNRLRVMQTLPGATTVTIGGNLNVAAEGNGYAGGGRGWTNEFSLAGGSVVVQKALQVGGAYAANKGNRLTVSGADSSIRAANMWMTNSSTLRFVLPAGGFARTPIQVDGNCRLYGDTELVVDVSEFRQARQTLVSASNMNGLPFDAARIRILPESRAAAVEVLQDATSLSIRQQVATMILFY